MDYEFIAKGFFFHKGRMKVTVSKLYKVGSFVRTVDLLSIYYLSTNTATPPRGDYVISCIYFGVCPSICQHFNSALKMSFFFDKFSSKFALELM